MSSESTKTIVPILKQTVDKEAFRQTVITGTKPNRKPTKPVTTTGIKPPAESAGPPPVRPRREPF